MRKNQQNFIDLLFIINYFLLCTIKTFNGSPLQSNSFTQYVLDKLSTFGLM